MDEPSLTSLDLKIKKSTLDEEIIRLPADFYSAYKGEVKALDERDSIKNKLESVKQRVELSIRKMPKEEIEEKHGVSSLTESAVKALVSQDKEVSDCENEYLASRRVANLWKALREAFEKKYKMIEVYTYLLGKEQTMKDFHISKEAKFRDRIGGKENAPKMANSMRKRLEEL